MKLKLGAGSDIENPTEAQIEGALRALHGDADSFAILGPDDQHFIQTSGSASEGFVLEYRAGSEDAHYRCTQSPLGLRQVLAAFLSYYRGESGFRTTLPWEKVEPQGSAWVGQGILVFFLIVAAVLLWRAFR